MPFFSAKVPQDFPDQQRLDKFIASLPNGMNRSKLKSGVNEILVNGKKVKPMKVRFFGDKNVLHMK